MSNELKTRWFFKYRWIIVSYCRTEMPGIFWIFTSVSLLILFSSLIFNICGIVLLNSLREGSTAQNVIMINLSLSEILLAIGWISEHIATCNGLTFDEKALLVIWALRAGVYLFWFLDMYLLSIDRFLGCIMALKHRLIMTRRNILRLLYIIWFICLSSSIALLILDTKFFLNFYNKYVWVSLDCIAVFIYTVTYMSIFVFTVKSERKRRRTRMVIVRNESGNKIGLHFFRVVGLILLSFVIFEFVPSITEMSYYLSASEIPEVLNGIIRLCYQLNLLLDPLIYIFLQERVRNLLYAKLQRVYTCFRRHRRRNDVSVENTSNNPVQQPSFSVDIALKSRTPWNKQQCYV